MSRLLLLLLSLPLLRAASAAEEGCNYPGPVLDDLEVGGVVGLRLALSSTQPKILTEARLSVTLKPPAEPQLGWVAKIHAFFPDPKPYGLPYSFEKLQLTWGTGGGAPMSAILDWTADCTQVGRSMYPGQDWVQDWEIPGSEGFENLDQVGVSLWGSRS